MASTESKLINNAFDRYQLGGAFYLLIPLGNCDEAINQALQDAKRVEQAVNDLLDGEINLWEYAEAIEPHVTDIDRYLDEINQNLEERLIIYGVN